MRQAMGSAITEALRSCQACRHSEPSSTPKFSTPVTMHAKSPNGSPRKSRMVARFYETNFGHYVLLNHDKLYSESMYLNLKNTSVHRVAEEKKLLRFVSNSCDGLSVTMELSSEEQVQKWLHAVSPKCATSTGVSGTKSPVIPRSPLLPTLTEEEE